MGEQIDVTSVNIHSLNQNDIEIFVEDKLSETLEGLPFNEEIESNDIEDIRMQLCWKAEGMFRWVELSIDYLALSLTRVGLFKRLESIPDELNAFYETIYQELWDRAKFESDLLVITLRWLMYAKNSQIRKTAAFLGAVENEYKSKVDKRTILNICRSLIEWNEANDEFGLAHLSVKEFLERKPNFEPKSCHSCLVQLTLSYLIQVEFDSREGSIRSHATTCSWDESALGDNLEYALENYAIEHWIDHCIDAKGATDAGPDKLSPEVVKVLREFCSRRSKPSSTVLYSAEETDGYLEEVWNPLDNSHLCHMKDIVIGGYYCFWSGPHPLHHSSLPTLFYIACQRGLEDVLEYYLDEHFNGWGDEIYREQLYITGITDACVGNQLGIANNLIKRGAMRIHTSQHERLSADLAAFFWSDLNLFKLILGEKEGLQPTASHTSNDETALYIIFLLKTLLSYRDFETRNPGSSLLILDYDSIDEKLRFLMDRMARPSNEDVVMELLDGILSLERQCLVKNLCNTLRKHRWYLSNNLICFILGSNPGTSVLRSIVIELLVRDHDINEEMMVEVLREAHITENDEIIRDLFARNEEITFSDEMVRAVVENDWPSFELLELFKFLLTTKPHISISTATMATAIHRSKAIAKELLEYDTEFKASEDHLRLALRGGRFTLSHALDYVDILLERMVHQETISEATVYDALFFEDGQVIQRILKKWPNTPISQKCLKFALHSHECVRVILNTNPNSQPAVDQDILCSALRKKMPSPDIIRLLNIFIELEHDLPVTEKILLCALEESVSPEVVELLLGHQKPMVAENVLLYALQNEIDPEVVKLLIMYQNPTITEKVLLCALKEQIVPEVIERLLAYQDPKTTPTEEVLKAACCCTPAVLQIILESRQESVITKDILVLACSREGMIKVISEWDKNKNTTLDDEVMLAAVRSPSSKEPFQALLQWGVRAEITEKVLYEIINAANRDTCWRDIYACEDFDRLLGEIEGGRIKVIGQEVGKENWRRQFYDIVT
ncbi:hypothetical protein K449DRAFT_265472 [Hypoxylon sp. EC38]|nr:hypothetical protein K449DRAFT_265472 [Hypoxylon sp. EC38]